MTDIFEIKTKEIEIKIGGESFPMKDPKFAAKVAMNRDWEKLKAEEKKMDKNDYLMAAYEMNKKTVLSYLPTMTEEFIENKLSDSALIKLIQKIGEISAEAWGAVVEQAEKK